MAKTSKSKNKKKPWQKPWEKEKDEDEEVDEALVREVLRAARSSQTANQLFSTLSEEHIFSSGQKVYVAGSMGQTNVEGTFKRMSDGGYAIIQTKQGEYPVLPHMVYPLRRT